MRSSIQKMLGWTLVCGSIATPVILCWLGVFKGRLLESHTHSFGSVTATSEVYESRWPSWLSLIIIGGASCGVMLIHLSRRENTTR